MSIKDLQIQTILWLQSESPLKPDLFWINGQSPISNETEKECFSWLTSEWPSPERFTRGRKPDGKWNYINGWRRFKNKLIKEDEDISNNLTFLVQNFEKETFILIQGCVLDTDEQGRKMPYIYCARVESNSLDDLVQRWVNCLSSTQKHINNKDKNGIIRFLSLMIEKNEKKKRICSIVLIIVLIIIVLLIVWFCYNNIDEFQDVVNQIIQFIWKR